MVVLSKIFFSEFVRKSCTSVLLKASDYFSEFYRIEIRLNFQNKLENKFIQAKSIINRNSKISIYNNFYLIMKSLSLLALLALSFAYQFNSDVIYQSSNSLISVLTCKANCPKDYVCRANKCFLSRYCTNENNCLNDDICYNSNCVTLQDQSPKEPIVDSCANVNCYQNHKCVDGKCVFDFGNGVHGGYSLGLLQPQYNGNQLTAQTYDPNWRPGNR